MTAWEQGFKKPWNGANFEEVSGTYTDRNTSKYTSVKSEIWIRVHSFEEI